MSRNNNNNNHHSNHSDGRSQAYVPDAATTKALVRFVNMATEATSERLLASIHPLLVPSPHLSADHAHCHCLLLALLMCRQYIVVVGRRPARAIGSDTMMQDNAKVLAHVLARLPHVEDLLGEQFVALMEGLGFLFSQRCVPLLMGRHPRLGACSPLRLLPEELIVKVAHCVPPTAVTRAHTRRLYQLPDLRALRTLQDAPVDRRREFVALVLMNMLRFEGVMERITHELVLPFLLSLRDPHSTYCVALIFGGHCQFLSRTRRPLSVDVARRVVDVRRELTLRLNTHKPLHGPRAAQGPEAPDEQRHARLEDLRKEASLGMLLAASNQREGLASDGEEENVDPGENQHGAGGQEPHDVLTNRQYFAVLNALERARTLADNVAR